MEREDKKMLVIFGIRGGCSSCCLQSNLPSYRRLTLIEGTCQTSRYWIPLPSMVSPYVSQVLITTPLFTIRGALSLAHWLSSSLSPSLVCGILPNASSISPWSSILKLPLLSDSIYVCISPDHFFQSPLSLSNDNLPRTLGIQGSLDGPWNLPHCNQPTCNQVTNNAAGYFQRYQIMEPAVPKMVVDSMALLWWPTWYVGMALHRDWFSFQCIHTPYISRLDFFNFGVSNKCMIHGMVRTLYSVLRTLIYLLMWRVVSNFKWNMWLVSTQPWEHWDHYNLNQMIVYIPYICTCT